MFDHFTIAIRDVPKSTEFYRQALAPLGIGVVVEVAGYVAFGKAGRAQFWLGAGEVPSGPFHLAFAAADRSQVDAFYEAALAAGGTDNGAPGLRQIYHPNYYGAFVFDPDGNNIEAVCHTPE